MDGCSNSRKCREIILNRKRRKVCDIHEKTKRKTRSMSQMKVENGLRLEKLRTHDL